MNRIKGNVAGMLGKVIGFILGGIVCIILLPVAVVFISVYAVITIAKAFAKAMKASATGS